MSLPNVTGNVVSLGFKSEVRVGTSASDATIIGLAIDASYNEDFSVQKCNVIGVYGPVSIDPQDYNCSLQINTFVPAALLLKKLTTPIYGSKNMYSLQDLIPNRDTIEDTGSVSKIAYMDFYDKDTKNVLASFTGVVITSDGMQIQGGYNRSNIQALALKRDAFSTGAVSSDSSKDDAAENASAGNQ